MDTFTEIQRIIDDAAAFALPLPTYVTVSIHADAPSVIFQFSTPRQVEQWAHANDSDLTKSPGKGHVTHEFYLTGDDFRVHCYCLLYDNEQVPADVA